MPILKLNPVYESETSEKYEVQWEIPDWGDTRDDVPLVTYQNLIFETLGNPLSSLQTRWLVGLKAVTNEMSNLKYARLFWQLIDIMGIGTDKEQGITATVETELLDADGNHRYKDLQKETIYLGDFIEEDLYWEVEIGNMVEYRDTGVILLPDGSLKYRLTLTIDRPAITPESTSPRIQNFLKMSADILCKNMKGILEDGANSDIKIVTSDGAEFSAHKLILQARCPVFAGMFNSDLLENTNGIVRTTDISGKTMKILLNYFYSGELLPNWRDDDVIVEFTYAAGKYQMSQVLELLDGMLGVSPGGTNTDSTCVDVQLLNLAWKLALVNAEKRLLQRVQSKVKKVKKIDELFQIFGIEKDAILLKAKEKLGMLDILKIWSYASGNQDNFSSFSSNALLVLALVNSDPTLENVEVDLLKRFFKVICKVTSTDKLFEIIGKY